VHRTVVEQYLRVQAGQRLLDIGCGPGDLLAVLPRGVKYVGFDPDERAIAAARRRHRKASFLFGDVVSVALSHSSFDAAIAVGVLHHLNDDGARVLFELAARSLRTGGRLVTIDPARVDGQHPLARWLLERDQGTRVRAPDDYERLARGAFASVRADVRHDLARVPYTHVLLVCER
jgi:SAM-dependent methyltransferase